MAALLWAWSSQRTLRDRFAQAMTVTHALGPNGAPAQTSYQAFLKLLTRWTEPLRQCVVRAWQQQMTEEFAAAFRLAGFVLLGTDGSKSLLARTRSNQARFAATKPRRRRQGQRRPRTRAAKQRQAKRQKAESPQLVLVLLYHLLLRLPWDWRLGPSDASERELLLAMIEQLPTDALVAADAGFVGYDFWAALLHRGRHFLIRIGGNVRLLKCLGTVRERAGIVYLWPNQAARRGQAPLRLRLVVVRDGRQVWYLVTSVLSERRLSDQQVAQVYRYRWRVEVFFRHYQQTFGRGKRRSHKAEHVLVEAQWSLLGLWAMLLHTRRRQPTRRRA